MTRTVDEACAAFAATLALKRLKRVWTTPVLSVLLDGARRFNDLQRTLAPVSAKVLAQRLAELQADGLVRRDEIVSEPPKEVVYSLTAEGEAIRRALTALGDWHRATSGRADGGAAGRMSAAPAGPARVGSAAVREEGGAAVVPRV